MKEPSARRAAAERILAMQTPDGALPMGAGASRLVPYFANLGALGLVVAARHEADAGFARRCRQAARRWALWYDARRNPDGTVYDFEGRSGGRWEPTGKYDSTDSYASTYLELVEALHRGGPDRDWLRGRYPFVRRSVAAMRLTMQKNGLTTATPKWPVMYTMDNVEVLRGLRAAASLARALGEAGDARAWSGMAGRTGDAIARELWDAKNDCYLVGLQTDGGRMAGGVAKWYPDVMANLMSLGWLPKDAPSTPRHGPLYGRLVREAAGSPGSGVPAPGETLPPDERLGRLAWWGFATRARGDARRSSQVREGLTALLLGPDARGLSNPATLGHAVRLLSPEPEGGAA